MLFKYWVILSVPFYLLSDGNHVICPSCARIDPEEELVKGVDNDILCVVSTEKVEELLLSRKSVLQKLESEECSTGEGVGEQVGGVRECAASFVQ